MPNTPSTPGTPDPTALPVVDPTDPAAVAAAVTAEAAPAPAPQYVTREAMEQFGSQLMQGMEAMGARLADSLRPAPPAPVAAQGPSLDDIQRAIDEGKPVAPLIAAHTQATVTNALSRFKAETVDPLQTVGLESITDLSLRDLRARKHYADYRREIDPVITELRSKGQATPANIGRVYDMVIGAHAEEIESKAMEVARREAAAAVAAPPTPAPGGGRPGTAPPDPDLADVFDADTIATLRDRGMTPDEFARKLGHADAAAYAAHARKFSNKEMSYA